MKKIQYILHWFVSYFLKSNLNWIELNWIEFKLCAISFNIFIRMKINLHKLNLPFPFIDCHWYCVAMWSPIWDKIRKGKRFDNKLHTQGPTWLKLALRIQILLSWKVPNVENFCFSYPNCVPNVENFCFSYPNCVPKFFFFVFFHFPLVYRGETTEWCNFHFVPHFEDCSPSVTPIIVNWEFNFWELWETYSYFLILKLLLYELAIRSRVVVLGRYELLLGYVSS